MPFIVLVQMYPRTAIVGLLDPGENGTIRWVSNQSPEGRHFDRGTSESPRNPPKLHWRQKVGKSRQKLRHSDLMIPGTPYSDPKARLDLVAS